MQECLTATGFVKRVFFDFWWRYNAEIQLIPQFVPEGKLLDVGCGSGKQLRFLQSLGWTKLSGIELSPSAAKRAASLGFEVRCGPLEETLKTYAEASFDVVFSTMVLEHVLDPFDMIRQIKRVLKPGGQFLFSTIIRDAIDCFVYGKYWRNLDLPRHVVLFKKNDLFQALSTDFDSVKMTHQRAAIDFVGSAGFRSRDKNYLIDRVVLAMGEHGMRYVSALLGMLNLTSRVSVRCQKKI